jgi:hypothetical protein
MVEELKWLMKTALLLLFSLSLIFLLWNTTSALLPTVVARAFIWGSPLTFVARLRLKTF